MLLVDYIKQWPMIVLSVDLANTNPGTNGYAWISPSASALRIKIKKHAQASDLAGLGPALYLKPGLHPFRHPSPSWVHQDYQGLAFWLVVDRSIQMGTYALAPAYVHWFPTRAKARAWIKGHQGLWSAPMPYRREISKDF